MAASRTTTNSQSDKNQVDVALIAVSMLVVIGSFFVWWFVRSRLIAPFDSIVTEQACLQHGDDIGRRLVSIERSNKFGLFNRSDGSCRYAPDSGGSPSMTVALGELNGGALLRTGKILGIILQLGAVSMFLRITVEPAKSLVEMLRGQPRAS